MAIRQYSSRSSRWPFGLVQSTLFILAMALSTLAQAQPVVVLNTPAQGSVTACASLLASWAVLLPAPDASVQTAINRTVIGIWASNVGVDQTPYHSTPTNPRSRGRLEARQQVIPAPITMNVTTQAIPLVSGKTSASGDLYTWTPVQLPANHYYVMYLQSLPGRRRGLDISVQSDRFFVSEGASEACLAGIVQSVTVTWPATSATMPSPSSTAGQSGIASGSSNKNRTGAIVGGVLGGLGLLGLLAFLLCCFLKRRKTSDKQDLGDFLASRGVNPYGRRSLTTIERRASAYEPTRYGGILAAIGIHPVSPEKEFGQSPRQSRASAAFNAARSSYHRQPDDNYWDGAAATHSAEGGGNRSSFSRFRQTDMTDLATILASDPEKEGEKMGTRRSKASSITTFAQSVMGVPYHPYNASAPDHGHEEEGGGRVSRHTSQGHRRHSSLPVARGSEGHTMSRSSEGPAMSRTSEGYAMSSINHHPYSAAAVAAAQDDDDAAEPEVMAWTGPTHKRASTAMSGVEMMRSPSVVAGEPRASSAAGEPRSSEAAEPRSSEGGSAESGGGLSADNQGGAPLVRKKSAATSHKTQSTKGSVTRKKAPDLPTAATAGGEPSSFESTGGNLPPPPSAYFTTAAHGPSTTTVNTGASAYVPSQAAKDRRSADLMTYQNGRQSSEVFGPGTSAPGQSGVFDAFAGAKDGPVHILMPDMPPPSQDK